MSPRHWSQLASPSLSFEQADDSEEVGLVPVGAVEQHGPHLPTGTDTIIASAVCDAASDQCGATVLPPIGIGCSYGHGTLLPGTLSLSPEQLTAVVRQYCEWAAFSGLRRLLFVNGHFGNTSSLEMGTNHIRLFRPDLRVGVVNWWTLDPWVADESSVDGEDLHASRAETSVMMVVAPELVQTDLVAGADDPDRTIGLAFRYTATSLSTNGVTGRPSDATAELGRRLFDRTVAALVERVELGRRETPPLGEARTAALLHVTRKV